MPSYPLYPRPQTLSQELALAFFFGKKKDESNPQPGANGATPSDAPKPGEKPNSNSIVFDEGKASKFFQHAKTVQETGNYEYAMQLWLSGVRLHPNGVAGLESFFAATAQYLNDPASKKGPGKDIVKSVSGGNDVDKYLRSLLEWGMKPAEAFLSLKALESAASLGLREAGLWIGERSFALCLREKNDKRRKELLMKVAQAFVKIEAADRAVQAAEAALKADPSDGEVSAWVRDLAATATMTRGGYGNSGVPDFLVCLRGRFYAIECKANGGKTTALQEKHLADIRGAGGVSLIIHEANVENLRKELENVYIHKDSPFFEEG